MKFYISMILLILVSLGSTSLFADSCLSRGQLQSALSAFKVGQQFYNDWKYDSGQLASTEGTITFSAYSDAHSYVRCYYTADEGKFVMIEKSTTPHLSSQWTGDHMCGVKQPIDIKNASSNCTWKID